MKTNTSGRIRRGNASGIAIACALAVTATITAAQTLPVPSAAASAANLVATAIPGVIAAGTPIEIVREGFEGTEGPIALADGSILFTENRADRIVRIAPDNSISTWREKTGGANALALRTNGDVIAAQTAPSGIAVVGANARVLASGYEGTPFIRPNDLVAAKAGDVYFTDPGGPLQPGAPAPQTAVYRLDRKSQVQAIATDIRRPNGIALSPDEKTLYIANTGGEHLIAFTVRADGSVTARRDFATLAGFKDTPTGPSSGADGIVVDARGRVYVATSAGVQIFSPKGAPIGVIALPNAPQNLAFGGPDRSRLYVVGRGSVYRIATQTRGVARPGK